jgi:hypothetical protein
MIKGANTNLNNIKDKGMYFIVFYSNISVIPSSPKRKKSISNLHFADFHNSVFNTFLLVRVFYENRVK